MLNKGVRQGSILGPLLFTFSFINDLGVNVRISLIYLYMEDAILYTTVPSVAQVVQNLHSDFGIVQQSLTDLKLLLNSDKQNECCSLEN